ncbi:unnamed protein product [Arabidopsis arenosa]|uniref:Pentatricopeptide repeat-containing protein n=1 Tax=Arabidopsis arenosa TaxID=38785 RepID=A0A8S1ZI90_ARAAE|nr:unnamed protein product [Arabidopsis arenosa]
MLKKTCSDSYRRLLAPIPSSSSSLSSTSRNRTEIELLTRIINDHPFPNHPIQPIFTKHIPLSSLSPEFVSDVLGRLFAAHSNGLKALEFFKYSLKSSNSSPTSDSFEKTLDIVARMRYFDQAWALMAEIRKDYPDLLSFKSMSILLCKIAKFGSYEETFVKMEKEIFRKKFGVDEFNILIREHMWQERGTCEEKGELGDLLNKSPLLGFLSLYLGLRSDKRGVSYLNSYHSLMKCGDGIIALMATALCARRRGNDAFECSRQTVERGGCVSEPVYRMLETSLSSNNELKKLEELKGKIQKLHSFLPPPGTQLI